MHTFRMGCTCSASLFLPAGQAVHRRTTTADFLFLGEIDDDAAEAAKDEEEEEDATAVEILPTFDAAAAAAAAAGSAEPNREAAVTAIAATLLVEDLSFFCDSVLRFFIASPNKRSWFSSSLFPFSCLLIAL